MKIKKSPVHAVGSKSVFKASKMATKAMSLPKTLVLLRKLNQKHGMDCPGCAWPDPDKRSKLGEFCENGVKAVAEEATDRKIGAEFFHKHSVKDLLDRSDYWLGQQGRLQQPMIIENGDEYYQPISWDRAFTLIADQLNALPSPDEAIFYTSGRTSNEAAFLYQLFVRMFGTNNLPDCSNMCHESSGVALKETLGIGKGSVTLEDLYKAEVILIFGQNPATNHPRMLTALEKAKAHGAKIISINPLKEVGLVKFKNPQKVKGWVGSSTNISDLYLQVRINEDVALLKSILIKLFDLEETQGGIFDTDFIRNKTDGFEEFKKDLLSNNLNDLIKRTGLAENEIDKAVQLLKDKNKIIACWAMGLTQHVNAVDNIREVVNLLLLKGSIGKPGAGTCPVRGHSNVQGDRTVGISERPGKDLLDKLATNFGFDPPTKHGYSVVEAIQAMYDNKAGVFFAMGGNFLSASPDTHYTTQALKNCTLTVHVSTKLNRSHLVHGKTGIILPCLGRTDRIIKNGKIQFVTVENSMGIVHSSQGMIQNKADLLPEPEIVARIAHQTLKESKLDWIYLTDDYNRIRDLIEENIPGFNDYNSRINSGGFELPNGARNGVFKTASDKAIFTINKLPDYEIKENEYLLTTIRSHDQFNTTIYGLDDRYRGVFDGREVIFMNGEDLKREKLKAGDRVDISSHYNDTTRTIHSYTVVPYDLPSKCLAMYFPEANVLVPLDLHARESLTPSSKSVIVKISKSKD